MAIKIINNKKVEITEDEWQMYQAICNSYNRQNMKGSDLFNDLFESDNNGIIIYLKPPTKYTSMEVVIFLSNLMCAQQIRIMHKKIDNLYNEYKSKLEKLVEGKGN